MAKEYANFSQLDDPWDLPPYFLLRKNKYSKGLRTYSGYWKEIEEELTAIRSAGESSSSSSSSSASPSYVGVRKTLEFYLKDGTRDGEGAKTDWIVHEYHHLRKDDAGSALFLQEDVVLRKVFKKCKNITDQDSSLYGQVESCVKAYKELKQVHCAHRPKLFHQDSYTCRVGLRPGIGFFGKALPNGAVRAQRNSKVALTPPETYSLRSTPKESLTLGLDRVHSLARSLQNLMIRSSYADHTYQTLKSLLTIIEQKIKCWMHSLSAPNEDLGVDCDPHALNSFLTTIEQKINLLKHSVSAPNEDLGVHCDPDGKSDNVWKHFTKICTANDPPDEVYAACHRCDKVLKAHPKKHGTSSLRRHIRTCSSCTNPSTDEDRALLHHLRTARDDPYQQQMDEKMDSQEDLSLLDPWNLNPTHPTPWYLTKSLNRQTQEGHWEEINKDFTAIRMDQQVCWKDIEKEIAVIQMDHQVHTQVPQYMGLRRTLQFHHQDGRKVDWIMFEYQQLDHMESPALLLQGGMVIRKVFRYEKDAVTFAFGEMDRRLNADDDDEEYFNGDGVNTDITTPCDYMDTPSFVSPLDVGMNTDTATPSSDYMDTPVHRKRKRTGAASGHKSEVWMNFTKIYNTDYGVVYVVCHTCDRGYTSGRSTNGTSHLRRHTKSCASKHTSTGNAKDATTEWETEIWPRFLPNLQELWRNRAAGMC